MSSPPPKRGSSLFSNPRIFLWPLGLVLAALFSAIGYEGLLTWRAYQETFGAQNASKDWLNRKLTSYSVDVYEELFAIKRLQNYCLQRAIGKMDEDEFNVHRRQVVGAFASFLPGTLIEKEVSAHSSFRPAWAAVQKFLFAAEQYEKGRQKLEPVLELGDEAAAQWGRLVGDATTREFQQRDGMEKAIVDFRPIAVRSFMVISVLVALCAAAIAAAGYAGRRAWQAERRRFDRFELLLATLGHDLRSPLQALVGAARLAAADAEPVEREKFVAIVHERSAYFTRLLDDLIDLSRSASLSFVSLHVDLKAWFQVASSRYRHAVESKGLEFEASFDAEHDAILFDVHRLTQCADNLVGNAVRYTDTGKVSFRMRMSTTGDGEHRLEIVVSDTGRGIDPMDQKRIFKPFVRVLDSGVGLGLGLSMVESLATRVGGTVHVVHSTPGKGSTFKFDAPVELSLEAPRINDARLGVGVVVTAAVDADAANMPIPRVLVVDDDPLITEVIAGLLPHMGYHADVAVGGQVGLMKALSGSYCAVITDIQMPELDGFELAAGLRRVRKPCPMIIALTAYKSKSEVAERAVVFDAVMRKPCDELELAELLDQAVRRWTSPSSAEFAYSAQQ